jgi:hypothetical protein
MPRFSPPTPERQESPHSAEEAEYMLRFRDMPQHIIQVRQPSQFEDEYPDQFDMQQQWYDEHMRQMQGVQAQTNRIAVAFHVHEVFANFKENEAEITETLGGLDPDLDMDQYYLLDMIFRFCEYVLETNYQAEVNYAHSRLRGDDLEKELKYIVGKVDGNLGKIREIIGKLGFYPDAISPVNISNINTWIQFVMRQPFSFQVNYVEIFIEDTFHAYDGAQDSISCVNGIMERLLLSIADACVSHCSHYKVKHRRKPKSATKKKKDRRDYKERKKLAKRKTVMKGGRSLYKRCDNPVYRKLIRLFKKEIPDLNSLSQEWAESAIFVRDENNTRKADTMTPDVLKKHFIDFLETRYRRYGLTQTQKITERAEEYEKAKIFERKEFG